MTFQQAIAFAVVAGMMAMFYWGRLRYDLVAVLTLFVAIAAGIVPHDKAFSGFSDDIVIIVASALVVSAAVARSGSPTPWPSTCRDSRRTARAASA